jgi:hypothetical protein
MTVTLYNHKVLLNLIILAVTITEIVPLQYCTASFRAIFHFYIFLPFQISCHVPKCNNFLCLNTYYMVKCANPIVTIFTQKAHITFHTLFMIFRATLCCAKT